MSKSIDGNWRGHYSYFKLPDHGSGFNATFIDEGGAIHGTIMDDYGPGEATFSGSFSFPVVNFIKIYRNRTELYTYPVRYSGRMSDDGKSMNGTWIINSEYGDTKGTWSAYRISEEENKTEAKQSKVKEREIDEVTI